MQAPLLLLLVVSSRIRAQPSGLTSDPCASFGLSCRPPRLCVHIHTNRPCTTQSLTSCVCQPPTPTRCARSSLCPRGELCADTKPPSCISCFAEDEGVATVIDDGRAAACPTPFQRPLLPSTVVASGKTGETCFNKADCAPPRHCLHLGVVDRPCDGRSVCLCFPDPAVRCDVSRDCSQGEACIATEKDGDTIVDAGYGICMSARVAMGLRGYVVLIGPEDSPPFHSLPLSPSPRSLSSLLYPTVKKSPDALGEEDGGPVESEIAEEDNPVVSNIPDSPVVSEAPLATTPTLGPAPGDSVCIGSHHLAHVDSHALVFASAQWATVLCDKRGSCATGNHVVVMKRNVMTMAQYCLRVRCTNVAMWVNSPRMRRGIRIAGLTPGLYFTPLAARWGTRLELITLKLLAQLGF